MIDGSKVRRHKAGWKATQAAESLDQPRAGVIKVIHVTQGRVGTTDTSNCVSLRTRPFDPEIIH